MRWHYKNHEALWRLGILLTAVGILLGIETATKLDFIHKLWPLLILSTGLGLIEIFRRRHRRESPYLILGVQLIGFSLLALYCNFSRWGHMGTLWPLFIAFIGLGLVSAFVFARRRKPYLLLGLLLLSLSIGFFAMAVGAAHLWWTLLVFGGLSIIVTEWTA
mgnify:FL=1